MRGRRSDWNLSLSAPTGRLVTLLVSNIIEQISSVQMGRPVPGLLHSGEPHYATDAKGRVWVRKSALHILEAGVLGEAMYHLLARALDVPVPKGAVHFDAAGPAWMSERLHPVQHWDPGRAPTVRNLPEIGRVVALDGIVGCWDRHPGNLLLEVVDETTQHAWAIDADKAVICNPSALAALGEEIAQSGPQGPHGLPMEQIVGDARATAERAAKLEETALAAYAREACTIADVHDVGVLRDALLERCRKAPAITKRYVDLIGSLK